MTAATINIPQGIVKKVSLILSPHSVLRLRIAAVPESTGTFDNELFENVTL